MSDTLKDLKRTHRVAEIKPSEVGQELTLFGWCHRQRDIGKLVFLTLRDRSGELQLVVDESCPAELLQKAQQVRSEYVLAVRGTLRERKDPNLQMETGRYELLLSELRILSQSETPPFYIEDGVDTKESLRLEYRYLDLRRPEMQKKFFLRHKVDLFTRHWFDREGFLNVETPILIKSTPEGARDYLVPSRMFPGQFFALPQSPQIYKQLLMCSGFDRYMQIARCFRDEDLRADRQPDFTQIDMEMSFVQQEDVMDTMERFMKDLFREVMGVTMEGPLPQLTWEEAMTRYGSDKPDTRYGMEISDVTDLAKESGFVVWTEAIEKGAEVKVLVAPGGAEFKRRRFDELTDFAKKNGAAGLVWMTVEEPSRGSAAKHLIPDFVQKCAQKCGAKPGDAILLVAGNRYPTLTVMGRLRQEVARQIQLAPEKEWSLLWITEFPMFDRDEETGEVIAQHHPFTMPLEEDLPYLDTDPTRVHAHAYDLVLNGFELGSGSIRIFDSELQDHIFRLIGLSEKQLQERFGFLVRAFRYGVPPHGGMALGLDRIIMLLSHADSIRDVIAFPKVQTSADLMSQSPTGVDQKQLDELGLAIKPEVLEAQEKATEND